MLERASVFLVAGQSNAVGTGDPADAPAIPEDAAYEFRAADDELVPLNEPVGPDDGGSAWAAFAREYNELTGSPVVIVAKPVGGAAQHPDADRFRGVGHWRGGSTYCSAAIEAIDQCRTYLRNRGISYNFEGVLWHQGESDAIAIDQGYHSLPNYRSAFREMVTYFRDEVDQSVLAFYIFKIGRQRSGDTDGWRAVRNAQDEFAEQIEDVHVVFDGAVTFAEDGRMQDELHYTQAGYNEMGRSGARSIATILSD